MLGTQSLYAVYLKVVRVCVCDVPVYDLCVYMICVVGEHVMVPIVDVRGQVSGVHPFFPSFLGPGYQIQIARFSWQTSLLTGPSCQPGAYL